jgi:hypothetical protein
VYEHFLEQQKHAIDRGIISRKVPRAKLQDYAREYYASLRHDLRQAESPADVRVITNGLIKDIGPRKMGFLKALGEVSRKSAIDALQ